MAQINNTCNLFGTVCSRDRLTVQYVHPPPIVNSFWVRTAETSPSNCTVYHIPLLTNLTNLTKKKYKYTVFSCACLSTLQREIREVKNSTKTKTSLLLLPHHHRHHHHTFSNFFFTVFLFSRRGNMPLISHQSRSPPWPLLCNSKKKNVLFYSSGAKNIV